MTLIVDIPVAAESSRARSVVESPFIVRVAGLPASALTGLSSPGLLAAIRSVLDADAWLDAEGAALADELHAVIGAGTGPKPALVGLRRSVFRGRAPRAAEWSDPVRAALPAELRARIERWTERLADRDRAVGGLAGLVDAEADRTLDALLDAVADKGFRHGLAQSSPALSEELEKWLARRTGRPSRQAIVRLARYLSRAAAKTSPYSTFTSIGAGTWTGVKPLVYRQRRVHGRLEFHGALLSELFATLSANEELRPALLIRANPSVTRLGDRLAALGPPPVEEISSVAALPEVTNCLAVLGDGWLTLGELRDRLAGDAPPDTAARIGVFLDRLIELGLLELKIPVDDQAADKFGALAEWLALYGGRRWISTAHRCAELSRLLGAPTDLAEIGGHRARLAEVRRAIADLRLEAGIKGGEPDGDFVHEHTVFAEPVAAAALPAWQPALDDLDVVRRWMAPFDPGLPLRLALGAYCAATFGPGSSVPFLAVHRRLLEDVNGLDDRDEVADLRDLLRPGKSTSDSRLPVLRELAETARRSVTHVLRTPPDPDGVVRVRLESLAAVGLPSYVRPVPSVAWFVQTDGPRLVLNTAMSGHGRGRARSLHLIAAPSRGRLPAGLEPSISDSEELIADSSGGFGHTLNVRRPLGGYELDYPFTATRDVRRPRIPVGDLRVEHDPGTGLARLRQASNGRIIRPAHVGMMAELLLPFGLQVLVRALGVTPTLFPPGGLLPVRPGRTEGVEFLPRVEAGLVVLRRATWSAPGAEVPRREPGEPDAAFLLRLHRWLAAQGIPDRCFVRASAPPDPSWLRSAFTKTRKPLYVDFASPWLVTMFERLLAGPVERVTFREVLPRIEDADGHVTELVIETTAGGR